MISLDETDNKFLFEKYISYKPISYFPNFKPKIKGPKPFDGILILEYRVIEDYDFQHNSVIEFIYCGIYEFSSKNGILQTYKNNPKFVNTSLIRIKLNEYLRKKRKFTINNILNTNENNIK